MHSICSCSTGYALLGDSSTIVDIDIMMPFLIYEEIQVNELYFLTGRFISHPVLGLSVFVLPENLTHVPFNGMVPELSASVWITSQGVISKVVHDAQSIWVDLIHVDVYERVSPVFILSFLFS